MQKTIKYSLQFLGWLVLTFLLLLIIASILIQTKPINKRLVKLTEQQISSRINGNFSVGEIDGNFFTNLSLKNILVTDNTDTLIYITEIDAHYNLIPLLYKKLQIDSVHIDHPYLHLKQENDSIWNIQRIIKPTTNGTDTTSSTRDSYKIDLSLFSITEGIVKIESANTLIPQSIQHINTKLTLLWEEDQQTLKLTDFSLATDSPNIELKQLTFRLNRNKELIELSNFHLKTAQNQIDGTAKYQEDKNLKSTTKAQSTPLQFKEFEFFLPDLKIPATPILKLNTALENNSLLATIELTDQNQRINLDFTALNFSEWLLNRTDTLLNYQLSGKFENVELLHWLGDSSLNYFINGDLMANGKGTDPKTMSLSMKGIFDECIIENIPIDQFNFNIGLKNGNLSGQAKGQGIFGEIDLSPTVENLFEKPSYNFEIITRNLDAFILIGVDSMKSNLNLKANISGTGVDLKTATLSTKGSFVDSKFQDILVDQLNFKFNMKKGSLSGLANGIGNFGEFSISPTIQDITGDLSYQINLNTNRLNLSRLTDVNSLETDLNINVNISGKGLDPQTAILTADGNIMESKFKNLLFDRLNFDFNLNQGTLNGLAQGLGKFGEFTITPHVQDLMGEPSYQLNLTTHQLDFSELTGVDSLKSNINLQAEVNGKGYDPKTLFANATVIFSASQFQEIKLDTLFAKGQYSYNNLQLDSVWAQTNSLQLNAYGNYNTEANSDLTLSADIKDIDGLTAFFPINNLQVKGHLNAHLTGKLDSLNLQTTIDIEHAGFNNFLTDNLQIGANAQITGSDTLVSAHIVAHNIRNESLTLDSLVIDLKADPDSVFVNGELNATDLKSQFRAGTHLGKQIRLTLEELVIEYRNQHWALQQTPAIFNVDSVNYHIDQFLLASGSGENIQSITAQGNISLNGTEDFNLKIVNLDISQLPNLFGIDMDASGELGLNMKLSGTAESPILKGDYALNKAIFNDYQFSDFGGILNFKNKLVSIKTNIALKDSGNFILNGAIPLQFRLDSLSYSYAPQDSINATLSVNNFPLAAFQSTNMADKIFGYFEGDISANGPMESPDIQGNLQLKQASVKIPEYGINYHDIIFDMEFMRDKINLNTFSIKSADGEMTSTGQIIFKSELYSGEIDQTQLEFIFKKFNPVNHRQFNMQVSGNANLNAKNGELVFDGDLSVPKSEIYLPAIFTMMGKIYETEISQPILVREMENMSEQTDTLSFGRIKSAKTDSSQFNYFKQIEGSLRIKIPKNTWIRNEDMRLEISGDLELIKHKSFSEIFGSVDVVRGQYDLLGKRFIIREGTISFQGGEEIIPQMDITASYTFRNSQRVEQTITVQVLGSTESPTVNFSLDNISINEGDALSYILFGKKMNELSIDQQENLTGAGGSSIAKTATAAILTSQITKFVGEKLNVDFIEIKSTGGFENATVVVGKYITNDLFVSYEQRFGETSEKDLAKYEVKLEYELFRFLFFQLNNSSNDSGFDVILKLDSE